MCVCVRAGSVSNLGELQQLNMYLNDLNMYDNSRDLVLHGHNHAPLLESLMEQVRMSLSSRFPRLPLPFRLSPQFPDRTFASRSTGPQNVSVVRTVVSVVHRYVCRLLTQSKPRFPAPSLVTLWKGHYTYPRTSVYPNRHYYFTPTHLSTEIASTTLPPTPHLATEIAATTLFP